jgi:acyl carrier protein
VSNVDQAGLEYRLTEILARVVSQGSKTSRSASELSPTQEFAALGVNSVDLMEFILRVEKELNVDVLGTMLPNELPGTLRGWTEFVYPRLQRPAQP